MDLRLKHSRSSSLSSFLPKSSSTTARRTQQMSDLCDSLADRRPDLPPRMPSFTKRHASFESPREVPLPSPSGSIRSNYFENESDTDVSASNSSSGGSSSGSNGSSSRSSRHSSNSLFSSNAMPAPSSSTANPTSPASRPLPITRPLSLPANNNDEFASNAISDRSSFASLPLPSQMPFYTLPTPSFSPSAPAPPPSAVRLTSLSSLHPHPLSPTPDPPTILPSDHRPQGAAHESFLNRAPPPEDSWIAVETTRVDYRLLIKLPGFSRDGITLAVRRRRILHVVADSWNPGGGHFERRISFGYDADLTRVRAEFDGDLLRITIPRRTSPS